MKNLIKSLFIFSFIALAVVNLFIFVSSIKMSEKINFYETETKKLHTQNIELEKNLYQSSSLSQVASEAAELEFTKKVEPTYLDKLQYALRN